MKQWRSVMWKPIDEDPPHGVELLLWLGAEQGCESPIGAIIGIYKKTDMGEQWVQKVLDDGAINTGIRASLITHYQLLEGEPDERPIC